jgi:hypothetical protein
MYINPDSAKGCRQYLKALNGSRWNKMPLNERAYEWRRLMAQRKAIGKRTYANPYF